MATKVITVPSTIERPITDGPVVLRNMNSDSLKNKILSESLEEYIKNVKNITPIKLPEIENSDDLKKLLSELIIRFDTDPDYYTKKDYRLLLTIVSGALPKLYESIGDIDLSGKQDVMDEDLLTDNKNVDGAINELLGKINDSEQ
jgi:hypothetical protein